MVPLAGAGLAALRPEELKGNEPVNPIGSSESATESNVGRPVRLVSIGFKVPPPLQELADYVDREGARGADVIALPELCRGQHRGSEELLHGPTITTMAALAEKHKVYIAAPIDRRDGDRRLNSVVLLDRSGQVVSTYDKVFPYWSEFDLHPPVAPGEATQVYQADFGRLGLATCFDANFPEVWRRLSDEGAEVVIWPSAYSGGASLQAHAINHHYYIFSCSKTPDCIVYDITGERILYEHADNTNISRVTLDLDRGIYHQNFNIAKRDKLLEEHPQDVIQEKDLALEQWFVLKAKKPGTSARTLARQYGLEELRDYLERSRAAIDRRRGWEFAEKVVFPSRKVSDLKDDFKDRA